MIREAILFRRKTKKMQKQKSKSSVSSCYKKNMRLMHSRERIEEMVYEFDGYRSGAISLSETWKPDKS